MLSNARVSFLAIWLTLAAPAFAGNNIYMSITGPKGQIAGESKSPHGSQWIAVEQIDESVVSPRDAATGQASGKRQHQPIKIVKKMDVASPKLMQAAASGEHLKEVVFQVFRTGPGDKEELYETIRLTDVIISSVQKTTSAGKNAPPQEEISFNYEKIEYTYIPQKGAPGSVKTVPAVIKPTPPQPR